MAERDDKTRIDRMEEAILLLTRLHEPKPRPWWKRLPTDFFRDVLYIIGLPVAFVVAYESFDRQFISAEAARLDARREAAIARLDQLQEINSEIYQLQSEGSGNRAFAIIEAKRGQIARLTDTIYSTWQTQPGMLGRFDLNALAEALLVQGRTGDALRVAEAVDTEGLTPIDAIDQAILKARILFTQGTPEGIEAARDLLRGTAAQIDGIERKGNRPLMQEKVLTIRLVNELWHATDCAALAPLIEGLALVHADNRVVPGYEDAFGASVTLELAKDRCS